MTARALPPVGWEPCSDRSVERGDPLAGTGGFGARWFLVELDGAWGTQAILQSRLDPQLARRFITRVEGARMRPLAIRRTGRRADERRRQSVYRWGIVDSRPGSESVVWGSVADPADLLEVPLDGSTGEPSTEPVICVCTHARHDQCCAVKGRPVVSALAKAFPKHTWECSHLGGDRFAATMIVLPHGLYFGRVDAHDAVGIVERYRDGVIDERYFRGRSALTNVVQAAQSFARAATGDTRIDALPPLRETRHDSGWTVELDAGESIATVELVAELSEPLLSMCSATRAVPVRQFALAAPVAVSPSTAVRG